MTARRSDYPTLSDARDTAEKVGILRRHSSNPSGFLALNCENRHLRVPGVDGFVAFQAVGRVWIQLGGPFSAVEDRGELLCALREAASAAGSRVVSLQVPAEDAMLYAEHGFTVNQVGMSYSCDLHEHSLRGKRFVKLRNKISRASREGVFVEESGSEDCAEGLSRIDAQWLRSKGRHIKELAFLIGEVGGPAQRYRRLFVARVGHEPVGYISYSPVFGQRPGWLHDLSRRGNDAPPGTMEAIHVAAIEVFRSEGVPWLHFGFTPFTGIDPEFAVDPSSGLVRFLVRNLAKHGSAIYPAQSQLEYKLKWVPSVFSPEYLAFDGRLTPSLAWSVAKVANLL